jgi:hypothetical protein
MGFSLGGHLSVSMASRVVVTRWLEPDQNGFAAHVGFYPACNWLKKNVDSTGSTGSPILIMTGEKDHGRDLPPMPRTNRLFFSGTKKRHMTDGSGPLIFSVRHSGCIRSNRHSKRAGHVG